MLSSFYVKNCPRYFFQVALLGVTSVFATDGRTETGNSGSSEYGDVDLRDVMTVTITGKLKLCHVFNNFIAKSNFF